MAYAMKSPIERTPENAAYVSNRNAERRAMEEARIEEAWEQAAQKAKAEEKQAAKVKAGEAAKPVQYSVGSFDDVLTDRELARFYSAVGEMRIGKEKQFARSRSGKFMVAIDDKIIYTDGRWKNPSIDRVDTILLSDETEIDFVRQIIIQNERGRLNDEQAGNLIRQAFGDELVWRRDGNSAGAFVWENSRGEGSIAGTDYQEVREGTRQYSIQFGDDKRLNALINYARDNVQPELLEMALGKKLNALFEKQNTRTSFQQANPVRIAKELAANLGTKIYTADIKSDAVLGYYQQRVQNIVVDKDSISDFSVSLFGIGQYVYGSAKLDNVFTQMTQNEFLREFADYMTHGDESVDPMFAARLS